jgi:hypothetical protein
MTMAHGQWTEIEARSVLEAWRRSGLGIEAFARSRGLVPQRLYWWKKKLGFGAEAGLLFPMDVPVFLLGIDPSSRRELLRRNPRVVLWAACWSAAFELSLD